jgi:hypothetical protein
MDLLRIAARVAAKPAPGVDGAAGQSPTEVK